MDSSFEQALIDVWRQALVENAKTVELGSEALFDRLPSSGCGRWTSCSKETRFTGWSRTRTRNPVGRSWHGQAKR